MGNLQLNGKTPNQQSALSINQMKSGDINYNSISPTIARIFELGTEINNLLADYIEQEKQLGTVRLNAEAMKTVYIIWGCISSLLSLVQNKGVLLEKEFSASKDRFLKYGYMQIINSILEKRI